MIYFDHNATSPLDERVLEAMLPFLKNFYGNPSALYRLGRAASSALETARERVAALVGVQADQVIFTSGGTEANNLALATLPSNAGLAVSAIEHPSIIEPAGRLNNQGHPLILLDVDRCGLLKPEQFETLSRKQVTLVSIMTANNETGAVQNIVGHAGRLRERGIIVHTDAVQALGKIPVDFNRLGVHLMTLSSHKIYGPKGCGALVFDKSVTINPVLLGGVQERGFRAGTENVAAIVGFGMAAELAGAELSERQSHLLGLRALLERGLEEIPGLTIFADRVERLPNTVQIGIEGVDGEMLLMQLDRKGIAVSSGSACASALAEPSPVLVAMGFDAAKAKSAIRISLGKSNTEAEVLEFIKQLKSLINVKGRIN